MNNVFDIANSVRDATRICTQEEFERVLDSSEVAQICRRIACIPTAVHPTDNSTEEEKAAYRTFKDAIAPLKKKLPVLLPHAHFIDNHRSNRSGVSSPWVSSDFDGIDNPTEFWAKNIAPKADELRIVLAFVSPSGKGVKIISQLPEGMTRDKAQEWFAHEIGQTEWDHTFEYARCVYLVPRSMILLYKPEQLFAENVDDFKVETQAKAVTVVEETKDEPTSCDYDETLKFGNLFYKDICERFWEEELGHQPQIGERHASIIQWAYVATTICDNDRELLLKVTPRLGKPEREIVDIVDAVLAYKDKNFSPFGKNLKKLIRKMEAELDSESENEGITDEDIDDVLNAGTPLFPEMPKVLPEFIKLITSKVPACMKPAVATQIFPALAAHLHQVQFRYINNELHEAGMLGVCVGEQSIGKGCVNEPINAINADLIEVSNRNKELARQWRKESSESENDDTGLLPENIYFPLPLPNMTDAAFTDRLRRAEHNGDRTIFTKMDEIELLYQVNVGGSLKPDRLICLAYDHAEYGQERVSSNAISDSAMMRWSWVASTTPINARVFFSKNNGFLNGALTRINISTIFQPKIKGYMPIYGMYDDDFTTRVQAFVNRLNLANGMIYSQAVNNFIERLRLWCVDEEDCYEGTEHDIFCAFYKRSLVIAFRKAMILYILNGYKWTKSMEDFIEWSLKYDIWCKLYYFSDLMITAFESQNSISAVTIHNKKESKIESLYELLPNDFATSNIDELKKSLSIFSPSRVVISILKKKGLVCRICKNHYQKCKM